MENVVLSLFRRLPSSKYDCSMWCLEDGDVQGREVAARGERYFEFGRSRQRDAGAFVRIARRIRQERIDLLHCHDELTWFYGAIGAMLAASGTRVVVTMHGRRPNISTRHLWEQRALSRATSAIVTVSSFLRDQVLRELKLSTGAVVPIANGIDFEVEWPTVTARQVARTALGLAATDIVAGTVGELSPVKNIDLALNAAAIVRRTLPNFRLVLVGTGALREALLERTRVLGLQDHIVFAGLRRDVAMLLAGFDLYVCSSDYEGISLSILEAMARGRAIVATAVGGNPELISIDQTGLTVPRRDADAMAGAILELARDEPRRERLGRLAQARVRERHSIERMIADYDSLYRIVMTRRHRFLQQSAPEFTESVRSLDQWRRQSS